MRLLTLPQQLRKWGLEVVEVDGWEDRGTPFPALPLVVVAHHTGSPASAKGDYPTQNVVVHGRSDLPGPLCQVGLGRSGTCYVVASGKANHAGKGHWRGIEVGNSKSVGIEAESPGDGTWTPAQRETYPILCAALLDLLNQPATHLCAHRESAEPHGRKDDPVGWDMDRMRAQTQEHINHGHPKQAVHQAPAPAPARAPQPKDEDDMAARITSPDGKAQYVVNAFNKRWLRGETSELGSLGIDMGHGAPKASQDLFDRLVTVGPSHLDPPA